MRRSLILLGTWKNVSSTALLIGEGKSVTWRYHPWTHQVPLYCAATGPSLYKLHGHVAPHSPPSSALEFVGALHPYALAQARYLTMRMKIYQITLSDACFRHSPTLTLMRTRLLLEQDLLQNPTTERERFNSSIII